MSHPPAHTRIRPLRWVLLPLLTLGCVLAGLPATSASAAAGGLITGTVTFNETNPVRTLEVFRQTGGTWAEDQSLRTTVATGGSYTVHAPAGEPVKLRVSYGGDENYGYWYGDVFSSDSATTVQAAGGATTANVDLQVPVPVTYSGRPVDRSGRPVAGTVTPTVNTEGASVPSVDAPISVDARGNYQTILPARAYGVYEGGVRGADESGNDWAWLGGGNGYEPNWYLNPQPGESHTGQDIVLPIGSAQSVAPAAVATTRFRAIKSPVLHGTPRKGAVLRTTAGRYTKTPTAVRYQWLRNGHAIRGAKSSTYRLKKADVRKHIKVRVTAIRSGAKVLAASARTAPIRAR